MSAAPATTGPYLPGEENTMARRRQAEVGQARSVMRHDVPDSVKGKRQEAHSLIVLAGFYLQSADELLTLAEEQEGTEQQAGRLASLGVSEDPKDGIPGGWF